MNSSLLLAIHFHDGRYHGAPDWPPSPARLFQALVAAAARSAEIPADAGAALEWLENLKPPVIVAPRARRSRGFVNWVPNNDLDAVGGDARRIGEIRAAKTIRPWLFDPGEPLLYAWNFLDAEEAAAKAKKICDIALDLYQLGRGVDMAWAMGECMSREEADERLVAHGGPIHRPSLNGGGNTFACPAPGSLESLVRRHQASGQRFTTLTAPAPTKKEPNKTKVTGQLFLQPPKPRFRSVAFDCPPVQLLFDLVPKGANWPLIRPAALVERARDAAAKRLWTALPEKKVLVERVIIGSRDSTDNDKAARIRIAPLPSIGHQHADHAIRRILVTVPPDCPISRDDIEWTFSGLDLSDVDAETGEVLVDRQFIRASDERMLGHYGAVSEKQSRRWRTVTPAALPESVARRRIDPLKRNEQAKNGAERRNEVERASSAVMAALRHAGVSEAVQSVRVQREPFQARGARAEDFAAGTRFSKHWLWHVEVEFSDPVAGPLIIGDGRYLGLGLMAPVAEQPQDAFVFEIHSETPIRDDQRTAFLRAVRRALMALDRDHGGDGEVSRLFSGHERDGSPARSGSHEHVFLAAIAEQGFLTKLLVVSPVLADRRTRLNKKEWARFSEVPRKLEFIRAGALGVIQLVLASPGLGELSLARPSRIWISETEYVPTRHLKSKHDPGEMLIEDVLAECARRGLPRPQVELLSLAPGTKSKPHARFRLLFKAPTRGPILLGDGAHRGAGLFRTAAA